MNWYYATKEKNQAGPVDEATLASLLNAGTITPETLVWKEGMTDWQPYRSVMALPAGPSPASPASPASLTPALSQPRCAECGQTFPADQLISLGGRTVCATCKPQAIQKLQEGVLGLGVTVDPEELWQQVQSRGYQCDIGSLFSRTWALLKGNFWPSVGVTLLGYLVIFAANSIPILNYAGMFLVQPQMMAGIFYYFVKQFRGEPATVNDSFHGFRAGFGQQALYMLITFGVIFVLMIALIIPFAIILPSLAGTSKSATTTGLVILGIVAIPFVLAVWYFMICWLFTPLLILDKGLKVLPAMKISRRAVHLQFWPIVLLIIVMILLGLAGIFTLCLGYIVLLPFGFALVARLYEDAFGALADKTPANPAP